MRLCGSFPMRRGHRSARRRERTIRGRFPAAKPDPTGTYSANPYTIPLSASFRALGVPEHTLNAFPQALPAFLFQCQLPSSFVGEGVEASLSVLFGGPPLSADPAVLFHSMEGGVERSEERRVGKECRS